MDDDITFGASVWATPEPALEKPLPPSEPKRKPPAPLTLEDDFDDAPFNDFDDFGPPVDNAQFEAKDDDFGDFEDFEEAADIVPESAFQDAAFQDPIAVAGPSFHRSWKPIQLDPTSSYQDIQEDVYDTLNPIWATEDISRITTDEPMREVEGVGQILSPNVQATLTSTLVYQTNELDPISNTTPAPNLARDSS
ncbi:hypothetical protein EST38_g7990 [Candolleomyces aberdarensis]|uniref:Uncharacterized protein n=1 Tax=Candolleomyces aberdarensis TaxID=2316362 RepID=A0A4Q2DDQ3_9AGAR|nr:hypothetical protein EST38_g7990 [Candolleomyces aberdarensis]